MKPERLAAIKARYEAATEGEWEVAPDGYTIWVDGDRCYIAQVHPFDPRKVENVSFIAHARTDIPNLVAEIERLRSQLERFKFIFSNKRSKPFRALHGIACKALEQE